MPLGLCSMAGLHLPPSHEANARRRAPTGRRGGPPPGWCAGLDRDVMAPIDPIAAEGSMTTPAHTPAYIWSRATVAGRLKEARELYRETYHRDIADPAIEDDLHQILDKHDFKRGDLVPVPAELLLAFVLRPHGRGKGRKRPPKEKMRKRWDDLVVEHASTLWRQKIDAGVKSKVARDDAAEQAYHRVWGHGLNISTIRTRMRLRQKDAKSD